MHSLTTELPAHEAKHIILKDLIDLLQKMRCMESLLGSSIHTTFIFEWTTKQYIERNTGRPLPVGTPDQYRELCHTLRDTMHIQELVQVTKLYTRDHVDLTHEAAKGVLKCRDILKDMLYTEMTLALHDPDYFGREVVGVA